MAKRLLLSVVIVTVNYKAILRIKEACTLYMKASGSSVLSKVSALGRLMQRWEDNSKIDFKKWDGFCDVGCSG